jgi:hypothetical protein
VSLWVGTRLNHVPGSSDPIDGAVDALPAVAGVCRDFAHLVVALLRAGQRACTYSPGRYPMDFHAVAEAIVGGQWRVVDGTLLTPGQTLVRIATGRDAADIAYLDNHKGAITPNKLAVMAVVDGDLPTDSISKLVSVGLRPIAQTLTPSLPISIVRGTAARSGGAGHHRATCAASSGEPPPL